MEMFKCPHCGEILEEVIGGIKGKGVGSEFYCPICGPVDFLEDSREIIISEGEMDGPGLNRIEETDPELVITKGKILDSDSEESAMKEYEDFDTDKETEEPEIEPYEEEKELEEDDDNNILSEEDKLSSEYEEAFGKQDVRKEKQKKSGQTKKTSTTRGKESAQKKTNIYHSRRPSIFYFGVPLFLVICVLGFLFYRQFMKTPQEKWEKAYDLALKARISLKESREIKDQSSYLAKLKDSKKLYEEAVKLGKEVDTFVEKEFEEAKKKDPNIERKDIEKQCLPKAPDYRDTIDVWKKDLNMIEDMVKGK